MKGSPLFEWFCFALVWGLLLIPLLRVSGGMGRLDALPVALPPVESQVEPVWVRISFSEAPLSFSLISAAGPVWRETAPDNEMEQMVDLVILRDAGPALELEVRWAANGRRAVEVVVAPLEGASWRTTLWVNGDGTRESLVFK